MGTGRALAEHALRPSGVRVPDEGAKDSRLHHIDLLFGGSAFAPDGRTFVLSASTHFYVFAVDTGKELAKFPSEVRSVSSLAISPDGKLLLASAWGDAIRRQADGSFAAGETLRDRHGHELNAGSGSAAFAADWDGNGTLDLIVGNVLGEVYVIPNEGKGKKLAFGTPRRLEAAGKPIKVNGDAAPVVADWDGDGRPDLIVGAEDGSVVWYRNVGTAAAPRLEAARTLIGPSPVGWKNDDQRKAGGWGLRVKPCVVDWDGDGRLDILLGDRCGDFVAKPSQTAEEGAEERQANDRLPARRRRWAATFREYQQLHKTPTGATPAARREEQLGRLREQLRRTKDEIARVQEIQERYRPGSQTHGFVWLFLRKPAPGKTPPSPKGP